MGKRDPAAAIEHLDSLLEQVNTGYWREIAAIDKAQREHIDPVIKDLLDNLKGDLSFCWGLIQGMATVNKAFYRAELGIDGAKP